MMELVKQATSEAGSTDPNVAAASTTNMAAAMSSFGTRADEHESSGELEDAVNESMSIAESLMSRETTRAGSSKRSAKAAALAVLAVQRRPMHLSPKKKMECDVWITILDIGQVDVATECVHIEAHIYVAWFDYRLKGEWEVEPEIDWDETWHPPFLVTNAAPESQADLKTASYDRSVGQFYSFRYLNGPVSNRYSVYFHITQA